MRRLIIRCICVGLLAVWPGFLTADVVTQDFDDFTEAFEPQTSTVNDWHISETYILHKDTLGWSAPAGNHIALLPDSSQGSGVTGANSYVQTPLLTNGVGTLTFAMGTAPFSGSGPFITHIWVGDASNDWQFVRAFTNSAAGSVGGEWISRSVTINRYDPVRLRIRKGALTTDSSWVGIDDIATTEAPARVLIEDIRIDPQEPVADQPVNVSAILNASSLASNIVAELHWTAGLDSGTIGMSGPDGEGRYTTANGIPGQLPIRVDYTIEVVFEGPDPLSPVTADGHYMVGERLADSGYVAMALTGDFDDGMNLVADYTWEAVINSPGLSPAAFGFSGTTTNAPSEMHAWGDDTQAETSILPFEDIAQRDAASAIAVDTLPAGHVLIRFHEDTLVYRVAPTRYLDASEWTGAGTVGSHTYAGWQAAQASVGAPDGSSRIAVRIEDDGSSFLRSPELPDGIGEVTFWYRRAETGGVAFAEASVQVSDNPDTGWTTVAELPAIGVDVFTRFTMTFNDRQNRYLRILNHEGARLAVDDVSIAHPGAGIAFSTLTHMPNEPAASDPVHIRVDTERFNGATITAMTTYYRTGSSGPFSPLAMTNLLDTYTTAAPVPAGSGAGPDGTGTVEFYVEGTFSGFEAEYGSPAAHPFGGADNPATFAVIPSQLRVENDIVVPTPAPVNTDIHITADLIPLFDGVVDTATLYYRIGGSGGYAGIAMTDDAANPPHGWRTSVPIPGQPEPGTPVEYYLTVTFTGAAPLSPTNYPSAGAGDPRAFVFRAVPPASSYTNLTVEGDIETALDLVRDNEWFGVVPVGTLGETDVRFVSHNGGTQTWRDPDQARTTIPIFGVADQHTEDIRIDAVEPGWLAFSFRETDLRYGIQQAEHQDFDAWTGVDAFGTYTNGGWILTRGRTTDDLDLAFAGRSVQFDATTELRSIESPELAAGIGIVSFRYRNTATDGMQPAELAVQVWNPALANWQTVDTFTHIISPDYRYAQVEVQNLDRHRVRLVALPGTATAQLLIDAITITHPGATIVFDGLAHTPASPTITNTVSVSVAIEPLNGAEAIQATLWFRADGSSVWDPIAMTNTSGDLFTTQLPIPRGPTGPMHYVVDASYLNPATGERLASPAPAGGFDSPAAYTNIDVLTGYQDFSAFTEAEAPQSTTVDGWVISETYILDDVGGDGDLGTAPVGPQYAFLPDSGQGSGVTGTNSYIQTPLLTNGVGTLTFEMGTAPIGGNGPFIAQIWVSDASNDWQFVRAFTNSAAGSAGGEWISRTVTLNRYDPVRIRIRKGALTTDSSWIGIDDIRLTYPPAYVTAGNFQIHPAYPSQTEPVDVSATIASVTDYHPAFNIAGRIYYRPVGTPTWSGPIPMTRNGSYFRTVTGIPPHAVTSEIEYYLEAGFKGYSGPGEDRSPMAFAPAGPVYAVRRHASDYSRLEASIDGHEQAFRQSYDGTWETILNFRTPVTDADITLYGFDFYDGVSVMDGLSTSWGDPGQDRPTLPYVGVMQPGADPLILDGTYSGQFLLRFNEVDRTYTLLRAAWQPFDEWLASADYFEAGHSADSAGIITQPFAPALWPASAYTTTAPNEFRSDNFEGTLGFMSDYAYDYPLPADFNWANDSPDGYTYITASGIGIHRGVIITQAVSRAVMLQPTGATGRMRTSPDPMTGVGSVSFEVRAVDGDLKTNRHDFSNTANRENLMFETSIRASELPINESQTSLGRSHISMLMRYQGPDDYYELRLSQIGVSTYREQLLRVQDGIEQPIRTWNNLSGSITQDRTYRVLINSYTQNGNRIYYEVHRNGSLISNRTQDSTVHLGGHGQFGFQALDAGTIVDDVTVGHAVMKRGWMQRRNYNTAVDVHDGWEARRIYIQNARDYFRLRVDAGDPSSLRSPPMTDGLGTIRFRYRRDGSGSAILRLEYSTDGGNTWLFLDDVIVPDDNTTRSYSSHANVEVSGAYLRMTAIAPATGDASEIRVDEIVIEPNRNLAYREQFGSEPAGWSNPKWSRNASANDYRVPGYTGPPLSLSIDSSLTDSESGFSSIATVSGIRNTPYQVVSYDLHQAANGFVRIRHTGGEASLIIDNLHISPWRARDATNIGDWSMAKGWVTDFAPEPRRHAVAMTRSRARPTDPQFIRGPWMTNGVGHIEFEYLTSGSGAFELLLQTTSLQNPGEVDWTTVAAITTLAPDWRRFGYAIEQAGNRRVRLLHTSASPDRTVTVDNIELRDFIDIDALSWVAYNALITDDTAKPIFIDDYSDPDRMKSGFLNRGPGIYPDTPTNFTAHLPYIESPYLVNGIGQVRFWYNRAAGSQPARLILKTAPTRETPDHQWAPLAEITGIDHVSYAQFDATFFVRDHHFLRIYNDTNTASRVGLDNILITAPYGATLNVRDLTLDPAIPVVNQSVHIEATVTNFFLAPSNITMRAYWKPGTNAWGNITGMNSIPMHRIAEGSDYQRFRTDSPIPAQAVDAVVQYLVSVEFEGLFSDKSSPYHYRTFTNPAWYEPVNLNTGQATPTPYYYTFSSLPGHVWINEINVNNSFNAAPNTPQYAELAGRAGVNIGNWRIKIYNDVNYGLTGNYQIPAGTILPNTTNHYGFYVLGDSNLQAPPRNQLLTTGIPSPGGIQLIRSMGAIEHAVAFDADGSGAPKLMTDPSYQFVYIGKDDNFTGPDSPLAAFGTGSNLNNFATQDKWRNNTAYTPGGINAGQVLVPWYSENGDPDPDPDPEGPPLRIDSFWVDTNQTPPRVTFLVYGNTNSYVPRPYYSTNLLSPTSWTLAPNASHTRNGNIYTVWGDLVTGPNGVFYRIEDTAP